MFPGQISFWEIELDVGVHRGLWAEPHWGAAGEGGKKNVVDSMIYHVYLIGCTDVLVKTMDPSVVLGDGLYQLNCRPAHRSRIRAEHIVRV